MSTTAITVHPIPGASILERLQEYALPLGAISVIFVMMVPLPAAALIWRRDTPSSPCSAKSRSAVRTICSLVEGGIAAMP